MSIADTPKLISPRDFADATATPLRTVQSMCKNGRLVACKLPGGKTWRIDQRELDRFLARFNASASASKGADNGEA